MSFLAVLSIAAAGIAAGWWIHRRWLERTAQRIVSQARHRAADLVSAATDRAQKSIRDAREQAEAVVGELREEFVTYANEKGQEFAVREGSLKAREERQRAREKRIEEGKQELAGRTSTINGLESRVEEQRGILDEIELEFQTAIEQRAGVSAEDTKLELINLKVEEAQHHIRHEYHDVLEQLKGETERRAKRIIEIAIGRYGGGFEVERINFFIDFPDEAIAQIVIDDQGASFAFLQERYGVELAITEDHSRLVINGQDFIGREIVRRSLSLALGKGKIDSGYLANVSRQAEAEVLKSCEKTARETSKFIKIGPLKGKVAECVGKLRYRASYTQNQWSHALEVGHLCGLMADELGFDGRAARRAGLLHDIGKTIDHEIEGGHAVIGASIARESGENEMISNAIAAHHGDEPPISPLAYIVAAGDSISGGRPGARHERVESYFERVADLERIARKNRGVSKVYALHAGRELRVFVDHQRVNDADCVALAQQISRQIEEELTYPGQIQVMVIRETVSTHVAS